MRDDIDWKRVYKAQLAAEAVPPNQAARLTSTVEDFTFNVQIARGPRATEEAGKVELEWAGKIEDIGGFAKLRLWDEEEGHPLWLQECEGLDLRLSLWVSKFEDDVPKTVCLQDNGEVYHHRVGEVSDCLQFEPTDAPDVLKGQVDARNDALQVLHRQDIHEGTYLVHPVIGQNGLMSDLVISHNDNNGMESLRTKKTLIYLQQSVPWHLRWNHKKRRFQPKPK